ncbi:hypothetical protein [Faecalimonas sp.]
MVDNGSISYLTKLQIKNVVDYTTHFFNQEIELEGKNFFFKNPKKKGYEFINYLGFSYWRGKTKIIISFSYSRFSGTDNFKLCENEKTIKKIHTRIIQILQVITGEAITKKDVSINGLDITNQVECRTKEYYQVLNLIYRALKKNYGGTLYFHDIDSSRKELQGFSLFEPGRGRKEAKTFFKIYNKIKERQEAEKREAGQVQALRGELSLKKIQLKKLKLINIDGVTRENLDGIYLATVSNILKENLQKVIDEDLKQLREVAKTFDKINFIKYEYLIFDTQVLKSVIIEEHTGLKERTNFYHKKAVIEELEQLETTGEIIKVYSGNFERLKKVLKILFKLNLKVSCTKKGVEFEWLE